MVVEKKKKRTISAPGEAETVEAEEAERLLAEVMQRPGGLSTDELVPPIVFREGKRERVKEVLARHGIEVGRCYLYSDSVADTPLFEEVGHPVVVNPKPGFRAEALRRGWEVVQWKGRWKTEGAEDALSEEWLSWES